MAARWKITSGRSATSLLGLAGRRQKSDAIVATGERRAAGAAGSTTSCSVSLAIGLAAERRRP